MGIYDEIQELQRLVPFEEDETVYYVLYGTVNGPDIATRTGIMFLSNYKVGLCVKAGWFEGDAYYYDGINALLNIYINEEGDVVLQLLDQNLFVSASEASSAFEENNNQFYIGQHKESFIFWAKHFARKIVRRDLHSHWDVICKNYEEDNHTANLSLLEELLSYQPECLPALGIKADTLGEHEKYEEALAVIIQMLELGADDTETLQKEKARYLSLLGRHREALDVATIGLEAFPENWVLHQIRGEAFDELGETKKALSSFKKSIEYNPEYVYGWFISGLYSIDMKDLYFANKAKDKLIELEEPGLAERIEGILLGEQKEYRKAATLLWKLVQEETPASSFFMGRYLLSAKYVEPELALERLEKIVVDDPKDASYLLFGIDIYLYTRNYTKAVKRWMDIREEAEKKLSKDLTLLFNALIFIPVWNQQKKYTKSIQAAQKALLVEASDESEFGTQAMVAWHAIPAAIATKDFKFAQQCLFKAESATKDYQYWTDQEFNTIQQKLQQLKMNELSPTVPSKQIGDRKSVIPTLQILNLLQKDLTRSGLFHDIENNVLEMRATFDNPPLIAVMGEYSVGKSTFINALLKKPVLPTGEGVTTGTITLLKHGDSERMRILWRSGDVEEIPSLMDIDSIVRETDGRQARDIHLVEIFMDNDVLKEVNIVDTPGLNAPFKEHQTTTEEYLTEADAILFLFNVENAGRSSEDNFLSKLKEHSRKAVAIVNQIDLVPFDEAEEVLEDVEDDFGEYFSLVLGVSGKQGLDGYLQGSDKKIRKSKIEELRNKLDKEFLHGARKIKEEATRNKIGEVLEEVEKERQDFVTVMKQNLAKIQALETKVKDWFANELPNTANISRSHHNNKTALEVDKLALFYVENSTEMEFCEPTSLERKISSDLRDIWKPQSNEYITSILESYDKLSKHCIVQLEGLNAGAWKGQIDIPISKLKIEIASWRKDLEDYIEQHHHYMEGFVSARGIGYQMFRNLSEGSYNELSPVKKTFNKELEFLYKGPNDALIRWQGELQSQFDNSLLRMQRNIKGIGSQIQSEHHRHILRLQSLL